MRELRVIQESMVMYFLQIVMTTNRSLDVVYSRLFAWCFFLIFCTFIGQYLNLYCYFFECITYFLYIMCTFVQYNNVLVYDVSTYYLCVHNVYSYVWRLEYNETSLKYLDLSRREDSDSSCSCSVIC